MLPDRLVVKPMFENHVMRPELKHVGHYPDLS